MDREGLITGPDGLVRCWWSGEDPTYRAYHDEEWGKPHRDERALFELLCLEGFQAGLSWLTILRKRVAFRDAFAGFVPEVVADFGDDEVAALLANPLIVRHRGKITATIANAKSVVEMERVGSSLLEVAWSHTPSPPPPPPVSPADVPSSTPESVALAQDLRRWGFRFVGPTTSYAFMQAAGIVDDHLVGCWRGGVDHQKRRTARRLAKPPPAPVRRRSKKAAS